MLTSDFGINEVICHSFFPNVAQTVKKIFLKTFVCCLSLRVMEKKAFTMIKMALPLPPYLDQELLVRRFKLN